MAVDIIKNQEEACSIRFYKIILSWDYGRLLKVYNSNAKGKDNDDASTLGLREVKNTYKDIDDYIATFEPLLFEEVKAQMVRGRGDEDVPKPKLGLVRECNEAEGFHFPVVGYASEQGEQITHNDLLLLSKDKFDDATGVLGPYAFALVERRQTDHLWLRMFLNGVVNQRNPDEIEYSQRLWDMRSLIGEVHSKVWILKICCLSTIVREYAALRSIGNLPFKDLILSAAESDGRSENRAWKISRVLMESIENDHNASQLAAINAGLSRKTFVLIQGPPGTGKTKTILGLLSAILHSTPERVHSKSASCSLKRGPELPIQEKYNHWLKASPWLTGTNPRDEVMPINGDDGFFPTTGNELKPEIVTSTRKHRVRVLVCAPSNSALDEIVLRLLNTGVRDENDRAYNPKIVRIGLHAHHSVQTVSMDYLVNQRIGGMDKDSIRASIIDEAVIVFSTLGFSGSIPFSKLNRGFDVVIIDEAAQAVESSTLIPLACGCKQVFLVGDPVQLPATVVSPLADKFGYAMSMFKRFQRAGFHIQMLKTQYRMHPEIRSFPSKEFYAEALEDGPDVRDQTVRDWHTFRCFGPFCFFDIHEGKETQPSGSGSWVNLEEADFVVLMHHKLVSKFPELKSSSKFAIVSPYRQQVKLLCDRFVDIYGADSKNVVDINTIDGFQGREKDVAIFSCVRSSKDRGIGFVSDFRRMNVGITRARSSILVVGSASTLKRGDEHWKNLVECAEKRNSLFKVSKPYKAFFVDESLKSMEVVEGDESMVAEMHMGNHDGNASMAVEGDLEQPDGNDHEDDGGFPDMDDGGGFEED